MKADWVACQQDLESKIPLIRESSELFLDTEADSMHHYFEKICLLQFTLVPLSGEAVHFLVDPLSKLDLSPLWTALQNKPLVLHGADYDLRRMKIDFQFVPCSIFDTMLAARLLGQKAVGLDALVQKYAHYTLDHTSQRADWSIRPLTDRMLQYAVDDTRFLPLITQELRSELQELGRTEWHRQQCVQLIELCSRPKEEVRDPWRIKGSYHLDRPSLAILKELWHWRDEEARQWDRPSFMVCHGDKLLELTDWARKNPHANLATGPRLSEKWPAQRLRRLTAALKNAWSIDPSQFPELPPRSKRPPFNPHFGLRMTNLKSVRDTMALELHLDPSILAPNAQLESLAGSPPKNLDDFSKVDRWLPWQTEVLGQKLIDAISGDQMLLSMNPPTGSS